MKKYVRKDIDVRQGNTLATLTPNRLRARLNEISKSHLEICGHITRMELAKDKLMQEKMEIELLLETKGRNND